MRARSRLRGFTLMEILISMTVLMVGLLPMLAVFKTALNNLNRSIEDTYASAIAQSVMDAIRLGLHDMKVDHGPQAKFFIFDHDGTTEASPPQGKTQLEQDRAGMLRDMDITLPANMPRLYPRDYCIVLPSAAETVAPPPGQAGTPLGRAFLYPRKDPGDNAARKGVAYWPPRPGSQRQIRVEKTYRLGQKLRLSATDGTLAVEQTDPLAQYSFAFTIRLAKAPDPLNPKPLAKDQFVLPGLYEVVVMVFRNFSPDPQNPRSDTVGGPGREFITYISE